MNQLHAKWFGNLDKKNKRLKILFEKHSSNKLAVGIAISDLIGHLRFGWDLFKEFQQSEGDSQDLVEVATTLDEAQKLFQSEPKPSESTSFPREISDILTSRWDETPDDCKAWWNRKNKFAEFAAHACKVIRKARLQSHIPPKKCTTNFDHFKLFLAITGQNDKVSLWSASSNSNPTGPGTDENFTRAIAEVLNVNFKWMISQAYVPGGYNLSSLLANLECTLKTSLEARA
jgi:hypothetical protein